MTRKALFSAAICTLAAAGGVRGEAVYVDNPAAVYVGGAWTSSISANGYFGANYFHNSQTTPRTATYTPNLPDAGTWTVWARWTADLNRTPSVGYIVNYNGGSTTVTVNQQANGSMWYKLGDYNFAAGTAGNVVLDVATGTTGFVIADAVAFSRNPVYKQAITATTASASSSVDATRLPSRVIDGSGMDLTIDPMHFGVGNGVGTNWLSASGDTTGWLKMDLGSTRNLERMEVFNYTANASNTRGVKNFDLYVSTVAAPSDNNFATNPQWQLVQPSLTLSPGSIGTQITPDLFNFLPGGLQARWVAFDITSNYGDTSFTGLGEVRFYVPEPACLSLVSGIFLLGLSRRKRKQ